MWSPFSPEKAWGVAHSVIPTYNSLFITLKETSNNSKFVTPVKTGVQSYQELLDSGFRRNDIFRGSLNFYLSTPLIYNPVRFC